MANYTYEAVNKAGELLSGQLEAEEEFIAIDKLRKLGLKVVDINENRASPFQSLFKAAVKVKVGELSLFSRQLAAMLDAGIPLTRSVFTLSRQSTNKGFGGVLEETATKVEGGMSFTESLSAYPNVFSTLYVGMIGAGEVGGTLQQTLVRLADQLQKDKALSDSIRSATFYPAMVLAFAAVIMMAMMLFLVPVFVGFFPAGAELPLPTKIVVVASDILRSYWYLVFALLGGFVFAARSYMRSPAGRRFWAGFVLRIPGFGNLMHRSIIARFARTLATLLTGGIPVVQALESAGAATGNYLVERAVQEASDKIQEGQSIAPPLEESPMFPPMVTHMIAIGEETGALPELLDRIADFFEEEVVVMTKGLTSMIEPMMLVFVGLTVGGMLLSLYLPIFSVITGGI